MDWPGSTQSNLKVSMLHTLVRVPRGVRLERTQVAGQALYHVLALLALVPWFFSWTGVLLAFFGIYVFGVLGINIGYHRLLTHKGFVCPKWLERSFAFLGVCCLQGSPSRWVATHRRHHEYADDEPDPHSPILGFLWAHVGWVLVKNETMERDGLYRSYAKDILRCNEERSEFFQVKLEKADDILWQLKLQRILVLDLSRRNDEVHDGARFRATAN